MTEAGNEILSFGDQKIQQHLEKLCITAPTFCLCAPVKWSFMQNSYLWRSSPGRKNWGIQKTVFPSIAFWLDATLIALLAKITKEGLHDSAVDAKNAKWSADSQFAQTITQDQTPISSSSSLAERKSSKQAERKVTERKTHSTLLLFFEHKHRRSSGYWGHSHFCLQCIWKVFL